MTLLGGNGATHVPKILGLGAVTNLLVHAMPILAEELTITAQKLIRNDLFGAEKYLLWGTELRTTTEAQLPGRDARPAHAARPCLVEFGRGSCMGRQIVHRLLVSFPALLGVLFLCFCLLQVVPADPLPALQIGAAGRLGAWRGGHLLEAPGRRAQIEPLEIEGPAEEPPEMREVGNAGGAAPATPQG